MSAASGESGVDPAAPGVDPAAPGADPAAPGVDPVAPGVDPPAAPAGVDPPAAPATVVGDGATVVDWGRMVVRGTAVLAELEGEGFGSSSPNMAMALNATSPTTMTPKATRSPRCFPGLPSGAALSAFALGPTAAAGVIVAVASTAVFGSTLVAGFTVAVASTVAFGSTFAFGGSPAIAQEATRVASSPMKVLVTGAAGFIGSHVSRALLDRGDEVVGFDNLNDYYDPSLKEARLARLDGERPVRDGAGRPGRPGGRRRRLRPRAPSGSCTWPPRPGVRYSLTNPHAYVDTNVTGSLNVLEACRHRGTEHLVFASSSSVYGANTAMPFSVHDNVDHPVSLYAATKKANELMAHAYSHLYRIPTTGLRFFTVYGPWGRPDMAAFLFTRAILEGRPIDVFNQGNMRRDFTYVDDIVEGVVRVLDRVPAPDPSWTGDAPDPASSAAPYRLYNIGNNSPVELMDLIAAIEKALDRPAELNLLPMQPGDVPATYADVDDLVRDVGFSPATPIDVGIARFVAWYREYYRV